MKITIIGFGNIAHALIAFMGGKPNVQISVFSSHPHSSGSIVLTDAPYQKGIIEKISDNPSDVIPHSDMILFTLPSHVRRNVLGVLAPYISRNTIIGAFPGIGGFYDEVQELLGENVTVFASQRVPYIARIVEKGKSVKATPKATMHIAVSNQEEELLKLLSDLLDMDIMLLDDFMEVNLSNSNPILHSARLYSMLQKNLLPAEREILFYEEWDNDASKILLDMDEEFMALADKLSLKNIRSLKEHYGVNTPEEMTQKMRNITAFKGIKAPLINDNGYVFDVESRYFQEDIGHDLAYILKTAEAQGIATSVIRNVYTNLNKMMDQK
jgi:ketopantoate reductase